MGGKNTVNRIIKIVEDFLKPPKVKSRRPRRKYAAKVCNLCHTAERLESPAVVELMLRIVPQLKQLTREPIENICADCLQRFIAVKAMFTMYDPMRKRTVVIARQTFPLTKKMLKQLLKAAKKLPEHVHLKVKFTTTKEFKQEVRRRYRRYLRDLAIGDRIDRLYEGYERPKKPKKQRKLNLMPSLEDVVSVIKGEKLPRPAVTIGCGDCDSAVCPKDCPRYVLAKQLEIFKGSKLVLTDDYDLSQYVETEEDDILRRLFSE